MSSTSSSSNTLIDMEDPSIKHEILTIIKQFLDDNGMEATAEMLEDETNGFMEKHRKVAKRFKRLQSALVSGDWVEVHKLFSKFLGSNRKHQRLLYSIYQQQYFELIENQELQKALGFLNKYLKPFSETLPYFDQDDEKEFNDLCLLLTCKSVRQCARFKNWPGATRARQDLSNKISSLSNSQSIVSTSTSTDSEEINSLEIPPHRLLHLLNQAIAYQTKTQSNISTLPRPISLLSDYKPSNPLPNHNRHTYSLHSDHIKCLCFITSPCSPTLLASGSSDCSIRLWSSTSNSTNECIHTFVGHQSRIWDLSYTNQFLVSSSGDCTVKLWRVPQDIETQSTSTSISTYQHHSSDVYSSRILHNQLLTAGYDRKLYIVDLDTQSVLQTLVGHDSSISSISISESSLVATGSKDCSVKLWDAGSGVCVKTFDDHLGQVSCVAFDESARQILTSSKDNCHRLWDVRSSSEPLLRYRGHQNTFTNFIKSSFGGSSGEYILSGSEDGFVYIWDRLSGKLVSGQDTFIHQDVVYQAEWESTDSLMASCSQDGSLKLWDYQAPLI